MYNVMTLSSVLPFSVIGTALLFAMTAHLMYHVRRLIRISKDSNKLLAFVATTAAAFFCFDLYAVGVIFQVIQITFNFHWIPRNSVQLTLPFVSIAGHIIIMMMLFVRCNQTFQNTVYATKQATHRWLTFGITLILVVPLFCSIYSVIHYQHIHVLFVVKIAWELVIEIMCFVVLIMFVRRLYEVLKISLRLVDPLKSDASIHRNFALSLGPNLSQRAPTPELGTGKSRVSNNTPQTRVRTPVNTPQSTGTQSSVSKHNSEVLNLMVKTTMLIISYAMILLICVFADAIMIFYGYGESLYVYIIAIVDVVSSGGMVYLQFYFADNIYYFCCTECDLAFLKAGLTAVAWWINAKNRANSSNTNNMITHHDLYASASYLPSVRLPSSPVLSTFTTSAENCIPKGFHDPQNTLVSITPAMDFNNVSAETINDSQKNSPPSICKAHAGTFHTETRLTAPLESFPSTRSFHNLALQLANRNSNTKTQNLSVMATPRRTPSERSMLDRMNVMAEDTAPVPCRHLTPPEVQVSLDLDVEVEEIELVKVQTAHSGNWEYIDDSPYQENINYANETA